MKLNLDDITFIIVTYQSEKIIKNCLDSLPRESKKIIVENSNNINLDKELRDKYDNIEVIFSENLGMGAGNNIGLKSCKTNYAYVLNPDTKLNKDTIPNLLETLNGISDFTLASPLNDNKNFPNFKKKEKETSKNKNFISVDSIDGFSMLFNLQKFKDKTYFDENFFLYLENDDLCLRVKQKKEFIYIITNSLINHKGSISSDDNLENLRNWHWMWSKFYYNKKHYGFLTAIKNTFFNFTGALIKYFIFLIFFQEKKKKIYEMRIKGIFNAFIGKESWFRI